jgi:hypothetical protein
LRSSLVERVMKKSQPLLHQIFLNHFMTECLVEDKNYPTAVEVQLLLKKKLQNHVNLSHQGACYSSKKSRSGMVCNWLDTNVERAAYTCCISKILYLSSILGAPLKTEVEVLKIKVLQILMKLRDCLRKNPNTQKSELGRLGI